MVLQNLRTGQKHGDVRLRLSTPSRRGQTDTRSRLHSNRDNSAIASEPDRNTGTKGKTIINQTGSRQGQRVSI